MPGGKKPVSVLVLIHDPALNVLLLERTPFPDYWQSVTGSQEDDEQLVATAAREVAEETGIIIAPPRSSHGDSLRSQNRLAAPHRGADAALGRPGGGIICAAEDLRDWRLSNRFEIFAQWRDRYPAGISHNVEHVFSLCVPAGTPVRLAQDEHRAHRWLPWREAASACFSWTNRDAILMLGLSR